MPLAIVWICYHNAMFIRVLTLSVVCLLGLWAQQPQDEEFAKSVKEWTTKPEFLSPLVDHLPKSGKVPSPKDVLGYHVGTPKKLTHYGDLLKYYRALAAASPRVKIVSIGKTDEGREQVVVFIANEETIAQLETYRGYLAQIADPRKLSPEQAKAVVDRAKPIYHLMGGLHSAETGPPEMLMELAYRLVVEESPLLDQIRNNVIVSITPASEPDGRDRYVDWYYRHKIEEKTEDDRMPGPPYWGKYVFHDNNRDINYSQVTMRNLLGWYLQWHPPIMHDLHESVPFLYTFSGQSPQNPTLDPILYAELPWFSNFEMTRAIRYGMPGLWTHAFVDMWSPGYLGFMASNHNGMLRMYETFGNGGANTMKRKVDGEGGGPRFTASSREWYRPLPPYKEVEWSMRNNTNYMETAVLSALELTASFPKVILDNFYQKSRNSIDAGSKEAPFAYVIPPQEKTRVANLINLLRVQGIEVGRATKEVKLQEGTYPEGTLIVKRNQPYGRLAKILLEKQVFPDPSLRTYDDTGWTMGLMSHTKVEEIADPSVLSAPVEPVDRAEPKGTFTGKSNAAAFVVAHQGSNKMITLRYRLKDLKVMAIEKAFFDYPAGSYVISGNEERVRRAVEELGLTAGAVASVPAVPMHEVDLPRVAVFSTWGGTQEVGWVRHAFDQFEVPFELIYKERVKQGGLRSAFDVIVVPNQGRSGKSIVYDLDAKGKVLDYKKSDQFPSLGMYGESEDVRGGMGLAGVVELENFVQSGGVLITLASASFLPAEFGLARRVEAGRTSPAFYAPGPIVEAEIQQPSHPIFYGYMQRTVPVRYANGPLLFVPEQDKQQVLMRFPGQERSVLSGLMRGVAETRNRAAIVDVPVGQGRVVMFATNPCYRWQNFGEFNMLFNAILHYNDLPSMIGRSGSN